MALIASMLLKVCISTWHNCSLHLASASLPPSEVHCLLLLCLLGKLWLVASFLCIPLDVLKVLAAALLGLCLWSKPSLKINAVSDGCFGTVHLLQTVFSIVDYPTGSWELDFVMSIQESYNFWSCWIPQTDTRICCAQVNAEKWLKSFFVFDAFNFFKHILRGSKCFLTVFQHHSLEENLRPLCSEKC